MKIAPVTPSVARVFPSRLINALLAAVLAAACQPSLSFAQAVWNGSGVGSGTGSGDINLGTNWTPSGVPTYLNFASINTAGATALTLSGDLTGASALLNSPITAPTVSGGAKDGTTFTVSDASNLVVGQIITGTGIATNLLPVVITGISGNTVTISKALTAATAGSYTFTNPALNFSAANGGAVGELVTVGSSSPGTARTVELAGTVLLSQRTTTANTTTLSSDINLALTGATTVTRVDGDLSSGTSAPTLTINGGVDLGTGGGVGRLNLTGGNLTINGVVSGNGSGISVTLPAGAANTAYTQMLTLTNSANSFSGGIGGTGNFSGITANASTVLANTGSNSALGSGGTIQLANNLSALVLTGFSTTQTTDRSFLVGNGTSGYITNNGTAAIVLNGSVSNVAGATSRLNFTGTYLNAGSVNQINGLIANGASGAVLGFAVDRGTWFFTNDNNSFTGGVNMQNSAGTIRFTSINDSGVNSALGSGVSIGFGSAGSNGNQLTYEYVGTGHSTNRTVNIGGQVSNGSTPSIAANGTGALNFTGNLTNSITANATFTKSFILEGSGAGAFTSTSTASLGDVTGGGFTGNISLTKRGSGTWTLAGSGWNHTGGTTVQAGKLILDYTVNDQLTATAPAVTLDGGTLSMLAKTSGATTDSLGTLQIGANNYTSSRLAIEGNGGTGFGLTVATLEGSANIANMNLVDVSSNAGNSVTVSALGTNLKSVNGVLMNNASTAANGRATLVFKDSAGAGFASLSGGTSGTLQKLTGTTVLDATVSSNTTNYQLSAAGTLTRTASLDYSTLTVNSGTGDITLDLGANQISSTGSGRGILFTGANNVTLSGTNASGFGTTDVYLHNYLDSGKALTLGANIGTTTAFYLAGDGFTTYSGTGFGSGGSNTGGFHLSNGVFRATTAQSLGGTTRFRIANGGVFEIGADLNGVTAGDFTNSIGHNANGQFGFYYDSGVSAAGADRLVNFGGAGAALTWGSTGFLTTASGTTDGGFTFKLSSAQSDARVEIANAINLNSNSLYGRRRTVEVANGSASVDARLSGVISGVSSALVKTGTGTLELTNDNTYGGGTTISAGTLLANNTVGSATGTGAVTVGSGATLGGSGIISGATTVASGGTLAPGNSPGVLSFTSTLALAGATNLEIAGTTRGTSYDGINVTGALTYGGTLAINFSSTVSDGNTFDLFASADGSSAPNSSGSFTSVSIAGTYTINSMTNNAGVWTGSSGGFDFTFTQATGDLVITASMVPEPSTYAAILGALALAGVVCKRRRSYC